MKLRSALFVSVAGALVLAACRSGERGAPGEADVLREPTWLGLRNFAVLQVDPNGRAVELEWEAHHLRDGTALRPPWEELRLEADGEVHVVTDRGVGNGVLVIDGVIHSFDAGAEGLSLRFGADGNAVSVVQGRPYDQTRHYADPR